VTKTLTFFCELCGELPATKGEPSNCPKCGGEIRPVEFTPCGFPLNVMKIEVTGITKPQPQESPAKQKISGLTREKKMNRTERAAEWFKKMREIVNQAP
jgi:hypothetical protein